MVEYKKMKVWVVENRDYPSDRFIMMVCSSREKCAEFIRLMHPESVCNEDENGMIEAKDRGAWVYDDRQAWDFSEFELDEMPQAYVDKLRRLADVNQ